MLGRWFSVAFVDQFAVVLLRDVSPMISGQDPKGSKLKKAAKQKDRLDMGLTTLHRRAVDLDRAGVGLHGTEGDLHQRRFAGAVLAEHGVDFAGLQGERDVVVGHHRRVALGDVRQAQSRDAHDDSGQ